MIFVYIGCFLLLLYYFYSKNYNYWQSRGVPCDKPFLFFGSFYNIATRKQHIFERIRDIYTKHGKLYVGIYVFNQPNLLIRSPDIIKRVLVKDFDKFVNRQFASNESVDPIAAHALFSAKDKIWRNVRTRITPVFTSGKMKLMFPLMKECAEDLKTYLEKRSGEVVEVRETTKKYAVDIISSCAFGIHANSLKNESSEIMEMATKLSDTKSFVRSFSIFSYIFAPKLVDIFRLTFLDKGAMNFMVKVFTSTMKEREAKNILRNDLIDLLTNMRKNETFSDDYVFDDVKMAAQAIIFFSAGNDTTSLTISFALYEMALNKQIQDHLRQEVTEVYNKHRDFTYESLQEMKYLDMVLNETLRKYPLTSFLNRKAASQYTFEETGFTLDKGVPVIIPVAGLHYDPQYFPDPEKYDPQRFSDENKHKIVPYTFLPFGDGPRNCIGQRFGLLVSKVALAYIIKDFVIDRTSATSVPLQLDTTSLFLLNKSGLQLRISKING